MALGEDMGKEAQLPGPRVVTPKQSKQRDKSMHPRRMRDDTEKEQELAKKPVYEGREKKNLR